jgi:preprotein translocase subunit SecF
LKSCHFEEEEEAAGLTLKKKRLEALAREYLVTIREGTQHGAVADSLAIKPTELRVQGLDARLLKNAGFTAAKVQPIGKNSTVQIHGLESEAGRNLNGCLGTVLGKDTKTGRIVVEGSDFGKKLIKKTNLTLVLAIPEV